MYQFTIDFLSQLSLKYWILQSSAIVILFIFGIVSLCFLKKNKVSVLDLLLAYPVALTIFSISGYILLSFGIPFNRLSVLISMAFILFLFYIRYLFSVAKQNEKGKFNLKATVTIGIAVSILACFCSSGLLRVSLTNDSMYFFSEYPRALVHYGKLTSVLDNFLTDASQGVAIIGTIPFLFGFDEMFGIQLFLNVCFVAVFIYASYDIANALSKEKKYSVTALSVIMLFSSMPFFILSRWLMANLFFMEYMFIVVYLAYKYKEKVDDSDVIALGILLTGLSIMRMEGALTVGFLILCILMLEYKSKDIALYMLLPITILQTAYLFRIFVVITLHTTMQFMTKGKAVVLVLFLLSIMIYVLVLRDIMPNIIKKNYGFFLIVGLFVVNIVLLIYDKSTYCINIKMFVKNLIGNSGWGLLIPLLVGVFILIPKKSLKINYFDIVVVGYILLSIATAWARGDALVESFGDSGNRVMMQVVPTLIFATAIKIAEGISFWKQVDLD